MSGSRWSKEDLESTFEEFLKTSLSSEDDTEKIKQLLKTPAPSNKVTAASLWWNKEADDGRVEKGKSKSFLKTKNSTESQVKHKLSTDGNNESSTKGKNVSLKGSHSKQQVISPVKSGYRDPQKQKRQPLPGRTRTSKSKTDTSMSKDSLEDISERSEEHDFRDHNPIKDTRQIAMNESSIDTSASYDGAHSSRNKENVGFDTLDELADKERFFQNLENENDGTVDYGKLNQDLSQTGGTKAENSSLSGIAEGEGARARNQSLDLIESSPQKPSMLSRVALLDSVESTLNTTTSPKIPNSRDTTQENLGITLPETLRNPAVISGLMGTNTSREMEALEKILQEAERTPTFGGDSHITMGKTYSGTPLQSHQKKEGDRSISDILREMDAIDRRGREIEGRDDNVQLRSNYQSPHSKGLNLKHHVEEQNVTNITHAEDIDTFQPVTVMSVKDGKKTDNRSDTRNKKTSLSQNDRSNSGRGRFSHVQSSGYGQLSPPPARKSTQSKSVDKSPLRAASGLKSSLDVHNKDLSRKTDKSPRSNAQKMTGQISAHNHQTGSSEVLANQLDNNFDQMRTEWIKKPDTGREALLLHQLKSLSEELNNEKVLKEKLQEELVNQENSFNKKLTSQKVKHEDEVFSLKQENFVLSAKLKELEGERENKLKRSDASLGQADEAGTAEVSKLQREIQEQENLLAGYQAENKRLYEEMKGIQRQAKTTETSMFKENQRLNTELANVKQELELKNTELQNKGIITSMAVQQQIAAGNAEAMMGANRISHLEGELAEAKRVQDNLSRELKLMQQNRFELERHVEALVKEKDSLARQLADSLRPEQVKELEGRHKEELEKLQKRIRWYTENQELLDKSNAKLRAKDDEIHRLKMKLEDFKSEAGMKLEENKLRAKEKAIDAKKIQDLERQVREMEQVIRRRHPNSLPAMMMVAASAPDSVVDGTSSKSRTVQLLENRVKKLEKELECKDELAQQDLRAVEQKYNQIKLQFEERIADLENQLSLYSRSSDDVPLKGHPHSHAMALERELDIVRDRSKKQVSDMQAEVDRVTAELNKVKKNQENMMRNESRQAEAEMRQKIAGLQNELKDRNHDIEILQKTIDRMRTKTGKKLNNYTMKPSGSEWPAFPHAPSISKDYEPGAFADGDLPALLQENQQLKTKVDQLQLQLDQQRVDLRRSLAETESVARQNKERLENQIDAMRSSHQKEVQRILAEQTLQSSSSKVAELQSRCDTQEVMIRHLQAQLKKVTSEAEQAAGLRNRESQLQEQINELQIKLREAKMVQAPEMRHFESLEDKITDLLQRQRKRESELDLVVKQNQQIHRSEVEEEIEKWKRVVDIKNQQLQVFRAELDSILEVLRTLQRQGVTLPIGALYS